MTSPEPCAACPWMQKGRPDITPQVLASARRGDWFCCHVHMGTCAGAQLEARKELVPHDQS